MCFCKYQPSTNPNQTKRATEDIICYKRLRANLNKWNPPYRTNFEYIPNKLYITPVNFRGRIVNKGFHSYSNKLTAVRNKQSDRESIRESIIKCIIPKGAIYLFHPGRNEYVSNRFIVLTKPKATK